MRFLAEGRIKNATDLFVGNILGYVCGAYERLEFVISTRHQLFLVDNEYTLLNPPDVPGAVQYVRSGCADQDWQLAAEVLIPKRERLATIPDTTLKTFTSIPLMYKVERKHPIPRRLPQFRTAARRLARELETISRAISAPARKHRS